MYNVGKIWKGNLNMELINFMATDGVNLEGILYKASSNISEKIIL